MKRQDELSMTVLWEIRTGSSGMHMEGTSAGVAVRELSSVKVVNTLRPQRWVGLARRRGDSVDRKSILGRANACTKASIWAWRWGCVWRDQQVSWRGSMEKMSMRGGTLNLCMHILDKCIWKTLYSMCMHFVVVQSRNPVGLVVTPLTAAHQASLSFTIS